MSLPHLSIDHFEGHAIHTLTVRGRPAWSAREIGTILGYSHEGKRLVNKITSDWSDEFIAERDFTLLVGEELGAVKAQCEEVPSSARGLLVLFESGLHLALVKTQMPLGQRLRRFLVDEILPKLVRASTCTLDDEPDSLTERIVVIRGLRADTEDRRFRYRALRQTADALLALGRIDEGTWSHCLVRACELALGQPFPPLHGALGRDWLTLGALAERLGVETERVLAAARSLGLLERSRYAHPLATRSEEGWRLTFRLSPEAVARVEGWLAEQNELELTHLPIV